MDSSKIKFDNEVYLHKLNGQELGYRNNVPGKAGRYVYISKKVAGKFFPPLSEVVVNDNVLVDIIPPNSDDVVLTNYVYHNDKLAAEGTRDEYRLYFNTKNDPGRDFFDPDDILIFVKIYKEEETAFKIIHSKPNSKREYDKLSEIIESSSLPGEHATTTIKDIQFVDALRKIKFGKKIIPEDIIEVALQEPISHTQSRQEENEITKVIRSRSFRDLVMYFYNFKCAVTGDDLLISYRNFTNLEAAHVLARASGGGSHPSNGIAMERSMHWAFDKGFFTITDDYKFKVHPKALHIKHLSDKDGLNIEVPEDSRSRPDLESLKWHQENVFGIFLKSNF